MLMPGCSGVDWLWFLGASRVNVALGNVLLGKRGFSVKQALDRAFAQRKPLNSPMLSCICSCCCLPFI